MTKKVTRTPVEKLGGIYCSPRCGRGCTKAEFDAATKAAEELASYMGESWQPVVWENLGWHYRVELIGIDVSVYPPRTHDVNGKFQCFMNIAKQFIAEHENPKEAFKFALVEAVTFNAKLRLQINNLKKGL